MFDRFDDICRDRWYRGTMAAQGLETEDQKEHRAAHEKKYGRYEEAGLKILKSASRIPRFR